MQHKKNIGPIPRGTYTIGQAYTHDTLGPITMDLIPDPANNMFGRSGFYIHGDKKGEVGNKVASKGCIVLDKKTREKIQASPDRELRVVK